MRSAHSAGCLWLPLYLIASEVVGQIIVATIGFEWLAGTIVATSVVSVAGFIIFGTIWVLRGHDL